MVLTTNLLTTSPATMPRTPPSSFRSAVVLWRGSLPTERAASCLGGQRAVVSSRSSSLTVRPSLMTEGSSQRASRPTGTVPQVQNPTHHEEEGRVAMFRDAATAHASSTVLAQGIQGSVTPFTPILCDLEWQTQTNVVGSCTQVWWDTGPELLLHSALSVTASGPGEQRCSHATWSSS